MKKNVRLKLPEENMEYTIAFPGYFCTYEFVAINDRDRVVVMNSKTKKFQDFSKGYFSSLISGARCIAKNKIKREEPQVIEVKKQSNESLSEYEKRIIAQLRNLSPTMEISIKALIGYYPKELADELERMNNNPSEYMQEYVNRVFGNFMKVQEFLQRQNSNFNAIAQNVK